MEQLSGEYVADATVHRNSPVPARVGANALTRGGREIHLAPGNDRHLPHEAWHLAQQRSGRVRPDRMIAGVAANVSAGHESEADRMGARAARLASAGPLEAPSGPAGAGTFGDVVQAQGWLSRASTYIGQKASDVSARLWEASQSFKESWDPRRSRWNPYWQYHNTGTGPLTQALGPNPGNERDFENAHWSPGGGYKYHTTERHGGEQTVANVLARTVPVGAHNSMMQNTVHPGHNIPHAGTSSRFATPAWHTYARNVAEQHINTVLGPTNFPANTAAAPLGGVPPHGTPASRFFMHFPNAGSGLSVSPAAPAPQRSDWVEVNVSHAGGQAWITKFHPVNGPGASTGAFAAPGNAQKVVPYRQVPWLSTSA